MTQLTTTKLAAMTVLAFAGIAAGSANAVTVISVEAAGIQNTTVALSRSGVETFSGPAGTNVTLATNFGGSSYSGVYSAHDVIATGTQYGGAGGSGYFTMGHGTVTIDITGPANYFGLWASAIDTNNAIEFWRGGVEVDHISPLAMGLEASYLGNPNASFLGKDRAQAFAFINYHVLGGFDQVRLIQGYGGMFENDNNTVGLIPEPTSWLLLLAGFGLVGLRLRRAPTRVVLA
ncbi:PEPxxWA-CTERM sorting domain-containing protein [Polymorphobacter sp. PAMC 29334]|uniref:Npun_F0296 family exosortase-dependent surface protein n=1 Tax=Polymorphobacter sp. PAMC 29334 TaxID=2862331 RepID=UPI001D0148B9|nr:PEPxxWA-CTERM sorting domain-containing protein [Polymorphobacter sp. PAMC 29334]